MNDTPLPRPAAPDPAENSRTAAVVVTYNRKELLSQCLDKLLNQTVPPERIYVIDNASTDGTPDVIPDDHRVTHIRLESNLGGGYGFYLGVKEALSADHRYVWLMDDDCLPEPGALEELLKQTSLSPVVCSAVLDRDGQYDLNMRRRFDAVRLRESNLPAEEYRQPSVAVDLFTFVSVLISTQAVRLAGLPVDDYFFMYDDAEYALRLQRLGITARLVPSSRVWHHGSLGDRAPRAPYSPLKHYYNTRNQMLVYRKYGTSPSWLAMRFLVKTGGAYIRLLQHGELNRNSATLAAQALFDAAKNRPYVKSFAKR